MSRSQMMRFDAQEPDVREALRNARHCITIGFGQKLTVAAVLRLDGLEAKRKAKRKAYMRVWEKGRKARHRQ